MDTSNLKESLVVVGPIVAAILSSYITWRVKSSSEDRHGFQALIDANDKFRDAMFREVERKETLIQTISTENEALRREINKLRKHYQ